MTIGQRIAELRKQHNLSQEALGEALGVSRQAISKWESDATLPEIDKLIAMSKRFGVTVGYLLGVEEATRQAEAAEECTGPSEAEVLQQYLESLPKRRPVSRKWRVVCAVILSIFLFYVVSYISNLESRITQMNNQVSNLSNQLVNARNELEGISDDISRQIEDALLQEYGLLANWKMEATEIDYRGQTVSVTLTAVLKNTVSDGSILSFYARLEDGSYEINKTEIWDPETNTYIADLALPMSENSLVYYLSTPEGTVCLADNDHELCYLADGTSLQVWCDTGGGIRGSDIEGYVNLDINLPWMLQKGMEKEFGQPEVTLWLVYNGEHREELVLSNETGDAYSGWWNYWCDFTVDGSLLDPVPKENDKLWVEYQISFENGMSQRGIGEEYWTYHADFGEWIATIEVGENAAYAA